MFNQNISISARAVTDATIYIRGLIPIRTNELTTSGAATALIVILYIYREPTAIMKMARIPSGAIDVMNARLIWIAVCTYVLVAIVRKRLKLEASMHGILQIPSLALFEKTPLDQLHTLAVEGPKPPGDANQLILFE